MIVVPDMFTFVHIPKTGGNSVSQVLCQIYPDAEFPGRRHARYYDNHPYPDRMGNLFAVVRNPWDRMVSLYGMLQRNSGNERWKPGSSPDDNTFPEFVDWILKRPPIGWQLGNAQRSWLVDSGGRQVVETLRFERLEADLSKFLAQFGVKPGSYVLPHLNRSNHPGYAELYDGQTRRIVEEHYAEDIELLGYEF